MINMFYPKLAKVKIDLTYLMKQIFKSCIFCIFLLSNNKKLIASKFKLIVLLLLIFLTLSSYISINI